jgi:AMP phosphorylase
VRKQLKLIVKLLGIESGKPTVVMDDEYASRLGLHPSDRIIIKHKKKCAIAIVNVAATFPRKTLGIYDEVSSVLDIRSGETVEVQPAERPESLGYIRDKILGNRLRKREIMEIVKDVVERHLSDVELAAFVTALHIWGISIDEAEALSNAMIATGKTLRWNKGPVLDKHSIGGVPGDKTTLLVVPIVAAAGFVIPKTSSRAITSPAGTADRVEVLCPVNLAMEEIERVVNKTNACLAWGGALDLAPADDLFIQVEYPLSIDPLLFPSIISKKKAIGAEYVVIDIPTGRGAKIKTVGKAHSSARDFIELGKRLNMHIQCAVTFGDQPVGFAVGPALEAREALLALKGNGPFDLVNKATELAGILLDMMNVNDGKDAARTLLKSGKAEKKFREIIAAQGGNPEVTADDIKVGDKTTHFVSNIGSRVVWINNLAVAQIAREAGAPREKGAGVLLRAKLGDQVKKDDPLLTIYSGTNQRLEAALTLAEKLEPIGLSKRYGEKMLLGRVPTKIPPDEVFVFER